MAMSNRIGLSIPVIANQPNPYYVRTYCVQLLSRILSERTVPLKDILLSRVPMGRSQHQRRHSVVVDAVQRGLGHALCNFQSSLCPLLVPWALSRVTRSRFTSSQYTRSKLPASNPEPPGIRTLQRTYICT